MILTGTVVVFAEMPGEPDAVFMEELGPGDCAGWVAALAGSKGTKVIAKTDVQGLMVIAPAFLEIARYDPALREEMFARVRKGEVWRAVLSEMERRTGGVTSAREIVAGIVDDCITRDWPEDEEAIVTDKNRIWIVAGGEGVKSGDRWSSADGVLWARLIGLPSDILTKALAGDVPRPKKESIRPRVVEPPASSLSKSPLEQSTTGGRAEPEKLPPVVPTLPRPGEKRRSIWRALGVAFGFAALACGSMALWAWRQPTSEPFSAPGSLSFTGERRNVTAGVAGKITEWGLRPGARLERGSVIAIIQPPMDEARARSLEATAISARAQAEFCEAAIVGRVSKQSDQKHLTELAAELSRLRSEYRVLSAVERGATTDYTLTAAERQRVSAMFATARADEADRVSSAVRDTSARREELREAEMELRTAQEEHNVQVKAFADIGADDNKEAKQDRAAAQRALGLTKNVVAQKLEVVNRLRKEIATMGEEAATATATAPAPSEVATAAIPAIRAEIAKLEEQLQRYAEALRQDEVSSEAALAKLKEDSAPRQIQALQPGLVLEAAPLHVGSVVQFDTILGRLTTRQGWEIDYHGPPSDLSRLRAGQDVSVITVNAEGTTVRTQERLTVTGRPGERPRLTIVSSRDDWRDGTPARIEASVVTGTLLKSWMAEIRKTMGL